MGAHRVAQFGVLAATLGTPEHRVTQFTVLVANTPNPGHRVTQFGVLIAEGPIPPKHRVTQLGVLVAATSTTVTEDALDVVVTRHFEQPANSALVLGAEDDIGNVVRATAEDLDSQQRFGKFAARPVSSEAIATVALAQALADAIVAARSTPVVEVSFVTRTDGLRQGQLITMDLPSEGVIDTQFLIKGVRAVQVTATGTVYQISAGEDRPRPEELLRKIEAAFRRQRRRRVISIRCTDMDGTAEGSRSDAGDARIQNLPDADFAVSFWVFPRRKDLNMTIVGKGDPTGGSPKGWVCRQMAVEGWELRIARDGTQQTTSTQFGNTILDVDQWHHVYLDNAGGAYVNGIKQDDSLTITNPGAGAYVSDVGEDVKVGTNLEGCLADLRVFDQLLGERAIKELASEPFKVRSYVEPLFWWKLDDNDEDSSEAATAFDYAGNSRTLALSGGYVGKVLQHQQPLIV